MNDDSAAQPAPPQCPPHRWRGPEQLCEHCGQQKGIDRKRTEWAKRTVASAYQCDTCRAYAPVMTQMWQHGSAFLCKQCHEAKLLMAADDQHACVICGEPTDGAETCGDGRSKCARKLRRRAERPAENSDE